MDANFSAITTKINGNLNPDNLAYPFMATSQIGADKSGTADATTQGYNSRDIVLRGSGWDGAAAQDRDIILRQIITSSTAYRLGIIKKEGATETELVSLLQSGNVGIGTTSPAGILDIFGDSKQVFLQPAAVTVDGGLKDSPDLILRGKYDSDTTTAIVSSNFDLTIRHIMTAGGAAPASRLGFINNAGTEVLSISSNGNVGIGTTAPPYKLTIDANGPFIRGRRADATRYRADFSVDSTSLTISAYDDVGGVYLPTTLYGNIILFYPGPALKFGDAAQSQTTVGAAGSASALPSAPTKYFKVIDSAGTTLVIPAYAAA